MSTENLRLFPTARERHDEGREAREGRAFSLAVDEFLSALEIGPNAMTSRGERNARLSAVVFDLLSEDSAIDDLIECLKHKRDVGLWLARAYAEQELAHYVEAGSL